jgi:hypothetical protein
MNERRPADPSAWEVLDRWCHAAPPPGSDERAFISRDAVAELIADNLDGYAYERLSKADRAWWQERRKQDEEAGAFSRLFGREWIVETMDDFLGWFVIRKVMAGREELAAYGPLCVDLLRWMESQGLASGRAMDAAIDRAWRAAEDLPLADELGELLTVGGEELEPDAILETVD